LYGIQRIIWNIFEIITTFVTIPKCMWAFRVVKPSMLWSLWGTSTWLDVEIIFSQLLNDVTMISVSRFYLLYNKGFDILHRVLWRSILEQIFCWMKRPRHYLTRIWSNLKNIRCFYKSKQVYKKWTNKIKIIYVMLSVCMPVFSHAACEWHLIGLLTIYRKRKY